MPLYCKPLALYKQGYHLVQEVSAEAPYLHSDERTYKHPALALVDLFAYNGYLHRIQSLDVS